MSNQELLDEIESGLPKLPIGLREKILDAIWNVLSDERAEDEDDQAN